MDFDSKRAISHVLRTVRKAKNVAQGIESLLDFCEKQEAGSKLWTRIQKIDFPADAQAMARDFERIVTDSSITREFTGFYFGLDGLNMPAGKGVEFGCSTKYNPTEPGMKWVFQCTLYPDELPSAALAKFYSLKPETLADYVIALGYLGLALRHAFESVPAAKLLGGAKERAVVWGFHDGDLFVLGKVRRTGFELQAIEDPDPLATAERDLPNVAGAKPGRFFEVLPFAATLLHWEHEPEDEGLFGRGNPVSLNEPLRYRNDSAAKLTDFCEAVFSPPVVNERLKRALSKHAKNEIQFVPAKIEGTSQAYFVINALHRLECLNEERSRIEYNTKEEAEETGRRIAYVYEPVIRASATENHHAFLVEDHPHHIVVTAAVKKDLESAGVTGLRFQPLLSST